MDPRIAEIDCPEEAYTFSVEFSRSHCNLYNTGIVKITPETNLQFCEDIRVVMHNRKFFGHHDGGGLGGKKKTMLLPSGVVVSSHCAELDEPFAAMPTICDLLSQSLRRCLLRHRSSTTSSGVTRRHRQSCCCTTSVVAATTLTRSRARSPTSTASSL